MKASDSPERHQITHKNKTIIVQFYTQTIHNPNSNHDQPVPDPNVNRSCIPIIIPRPSRLGFAGISSSIAVEEEAADA